MSHRLGPDPITVAGAAMAFFGVVLYLIDSSWWEVAVLWFILGVVIAVLEIRRVARLSKRR